MNEGSASDDKRAADGEPESGFPEPPGPDEGDRSKDPEPHHALNNPVGEPDPTEYPDPYEQRPDPKGEDHPPTGGGSTSEPHPERNPQPESDA
jgi:hypothetical protein